MTFRILNSEARGQIAAHLFGGPTHTHPRAGSVSGTDVIATPGVEPPPYDPKGGHTYGTGGEGGGGTGGGYGGGGGGGGGPPIKTFSRTQGGAWPNCTLRHGGGLYLPRRPNNSGECPSPAGPVTYIKQGNWCCPTKSDTSTAPTGGGAQPLSCGNIEKMSTYYRFKKSQVNTPTPDSGGLQTYGQFTEDMKRQCARAFPNVGMPTPGEWRTKKHQLPGGDEGWEFICCRQKAFLPPGTTVVGFSGPPTTTPPQTGPDPPYTEPTDGHPPTGGQGGKPGDDNKRQWPRTPSDDKLVFTCYPMADIPGRQAGWCSHSGELRAKGTTIPCDQLTLSSTHLTMLSTTNHSCTDAGNTGSLVSRRDIMVHNPCNETIPKGRRITAVRKWTGDWQFIEAVVMVVCCET